MLASCSFPCSSGLVHEGCLSLWPLQITRRAAALPPRNVDDLADGGRARREEWAEQQRALAAVRELEGVTFKPAKQSTDAYDHVSHCVAYPNDTNTSGSLAAVIVSSFPRWDVRYTRASSTTFWATKARCSPARGPLPRPAGPLPYQPQEPRRLPGPRGAQAAAAGAAGCGVGHGA